MNRSALAGITLFLVAWTSCGSGPLPDDQPIMTEAEVLECIATWDEMQLEFKNLPPDEALKYHDPLHSEVFDAGDYEPWILFAIDRGYPWTFEEHCPDAIGQ